jgi:hypothetical protein
MFKGLHSQSGLRYMIDISLFPMLPSIVKYKETIHKEKQRGEVVGFANFTA